MNIVAVIAAYNEEEKIGEVVRDVLEHAGRVVVVDDGSFDRTEEISWRAGAAVLRHVINRGQGAALRTGIDWALAQGADIIVTFDADGQFVAEEIPAVVSALRENGADAALGTRFGSKGSNVPFIRKLMLKAGILFTWMVSGVKLSDTHNGFRALTRKAAQDIDITQDRMAHSSEIIDEIARKRLSFEEVPVTVRYTEYSMRKGQRSLAAFRIARDVFYGKFFRRYRS